MALMGPQETIMKSWTLVLVVAGMFSCSHDSAAANLPPIAIQEDAVVSSPPPPPAQEQEAPAPPVQGEAVVRQTPEELQQLVAPIALYPDELVAQILAASTYPTEIVQADRWVEQHPDLKGAPLAEAVDKQPWDASVKAVAQFPSVLGNMDKNLSWTSALGDAYVNQPQDVTAAVQVMRKRAQQAGNLKTTAQQTVSTERETIVIEPARPEVVYVPVYDPWVVYGPPLIAWPGCVTK